MKLKISYNHPSQSSSCQSESAEAPTSNSEVEKLKIENRRLKEQIALLVKEKEAAISKYTHCFVLP